MTDQTAAALELNELELKYLKIAVERLAADYESHGKAQSLERARTLLARLEGHTGTPKGMTPERMMAFQERFMEAAAQGQDAAAEVLTEWWTEILRSEAHAASKLAPMLVDLMRTTSGQTALGVIHSVGVKLKALEGRLGSSPALAELGPWLAQGLDAAQAGAPLWPDDPDLRS